MSMTRKRRLTCTPLKAGKVLYLVHVRGYSQSQTGVIVELNTGTVNHVVHGRRFPGAHPITVTGY